MPGTISAPPASQSPASQSTASQSPTSLPGFRPRGGPRTTRIALAGCGVVGGELVRLVEQQRATLSEAHGLDIEIVRVLVRDTTRSRPGVHDDSLLTSDVDEFLGSDADVVVEALGGLDPAGRIAAATLGRGARFVTANKALIAAHGTELSTLAARNGGSIRFDAAVGGGVPVLRLIESALGGTSPQLVRGILNGTSNFILTLLEHGKSYEGALAEARRRGFAEADPGRDLDGRDSADKIAIVAWRAFGIAPEKVIVRRRGLLPSPERLVRIAQLADGRLRLVADCELVDAGRSVVASVEPVVVRTNSALGRTLFEDNRVELHTGWNAPLCATGPGAGGAPTATAILSDLVAPRTTSRHLSSTVTAAKDERAFRWIVGTHHAPAILRSTLCTAGIAVDEIGRSGNETWARTDRAAWATLATALTLLGTGGVEPVVARLDDRPAHGRGVIE